MLLCKALPIYLPLVGDACNVSKSVKKYIEIVSARTNYENQRVEATMQVHEHLAKHELSSPARCCEEPPPRHWSQAHATRNLLPRPAPTLINFAKGTPATLSPNYAMFPNFGATQNKLTVLQLTTRPSRPNSETFRGSSRAAAALETMLADTGTNIYCNISTLIS